MKPSERIEELAREAHSHSIDPCFNGNHPDIGDYLEAIARYLDENPPPLYSIQPVPKVHEPCGVITQGDTAEHPKVKP